jgi:hypothetical protein
MPIPQAKSAEQINRIPVPSPAAGDNGKALVYNHGTTSYILDSPSASVDASGVAIIDTEGNFTAEDVEGALSELFTSVSDGKDLIATAITGKGGTASGSDTFAQLSGAIDGLTTGGGNVMSVDYCIETDTGAHSLLPDTTYEIA